MGASSRLLVGFYSFGGAVQPPPRALSCYLLSTERDVALQLQVNVSFSRRPDRTWRRPPVRPRNKWLDQLRNNFTRPTRDLWRRAVDRT